MKFKNIAPPPYVKNPTFDRFDNKDRPTAQFFSFFLKKYQPLF